MGRPCLEPSRHELAFQTGLQIDQESTHTCKELVVGRWSTACRRFTSRPPPPQRSAWSPRVRAGSTVKPAPSAEPRPRSVGRSSVGAPAGSLRCPAQSLLAFPFPLDVCVGSISASRSVRWEVRSSSIHRAYERPVHRLLDLSYCKPLERLAPLTELPNGVLEPIADLPRQEAPVKHKPGDVAVGQRLVGVCYRLNRRIISRPTSTHLRLSSPSSSGETFTTQSIRRIAGSGSRGSRTRLCPLPRVLPRPGGDPLPGSGLGGPRTRRRFGFLDQGPCARPHSRASRRTSTAPIRRNRGCRDPSCDGTWRQNGRGVG